MEGGDVTAATPVPEGKTYRFHYFNFIYARGASIEMLLRHAGVDYEFRGIAFKDWPDIKANEFGGRQLPMLQLKDGRTFNQSNAIMRYLAAEHGYAPETNLIGL